MVFIAIIDSQIVQIVYLVLIILLYQNIKSIRPIPITIILQPIFLSIHVFLYKVRTHYLSIIQILYLIPRVAITNAE